MQKLSIVLVLVALFGLGKPECPQVNDLPVYYDSNTFFCARFYYGFGDDLALHGCNGCSLQEYADVYDGANWDAGEGRHYPVGSLIVRPGCTLYTFHEPNYNGGWAVYEGPNIWPKLQDGSDATDEGCARGRPGMMCRCQMRHFNCVPEDSFNVVLRCDATNAREDSECNYIKTVGTKYTQSFSESMSIDTTIKASMSANFFDIFGASIGVSVHTGYNWKETSTETMNDEEKFEIKATAPAGYVLTIEQAVGHCDGNTAKTELFRITHTKDGKIVSQELEKQFRNGTVLKV